MLPSWITDQVMGDRRKPRWLTDSPEDQIENEGDPTIQMDMVRDILEKRSGRKAGEGRPRFDPRGIKKEDVDAMEAEERRRVSGLSLFL